MIDENHRHMVRVPPEWMQLIDRYVITDCDVCHELVELTSPLNPARKLHGMTRKQDWSPCGDCAKRTRRRILRYKRIIDTLRVGGCERARMRTRVRTGPSKRHIKEADRDG